MTILKGIPYTGTKFYIMDQLIKLFPENIVDFIEPFCGGLNVSVNVKSQNYLLNDYCSPLIDLYKHLKSFDSFESLEQDIKHLFNIYSENKHDKYLTQDQYLNLRKDYNNNKNILLLILLYSFSFSNGIRFNSKNEFNLSYGKSRPINFDSLKNIFEYVNLNKVYFTSFDFNYFLGFLKDSFLNKRNKDGIFIYFDPPYFNTEATYSRNYSNESEQYLYQFLEYCVINNIKFGLSNVFINGKPNSKKFENFLNKYNSELKLHYINLDYSKCNYQRKPKKMQEIYLTNCC